MVLLPGLALIAAMLAATPYTALAANAEVERAAAGSSSYPPLSPQVTFDAVLALPAGQPGQVFRYGDAAPQFAELWLPAGEGPVPLVAFIHGGCWLNEYSIDHSHALATALTRAGYAVWNIEYRRLGDAGGGWPGSLRDVQSALARLAVLSHPRLDLARLALAGHSAGGHLALLAGASPPSGVAPRAVFGLAPITDIEHYAAGEGACNRAAKRFLGDAGELANPARRAAPAGTVLLLGREDRIVPYQVPFLKADTVVGMPAGHFDWIYPGTPAWARFLEELGKVLR